MQRVLASYFIRSSSSCSFEMNLGQANKNWVIRCNTVEKTVMNKQVNACRQCVSVCAGVGCDENMFTLSIFVRIESCRLVEVCILCHGH